MSTERTSDSPGDILIVDDIPENLHLLARILSDAGHRVRPTTDGQLALDAVRVDPPDLVVLDVKMPGMDGFEVCRRLKAHEGSREVPVIFVSALNESVSKIDGFEAGGVDYITKPFEPNEVVARVKIHLTLRRLQAALERQNRELENRVLERTADLVAANRELKTQMVERERALEERTRLATAIEQSAEGILITDREGTIQYVNPAFERISGYAREEAVGQNPRILKSGRQTAQFYEELWKTITRGEVWTGHIINKRKDGTLYEQDATISPVRNLSGEITNFVSVKRDVTREVELEAQLRQAQKMEAIGQLAGGVAHDFNNILTAILGNAELVRNGMEKNLPRDYQLLSDLAQIDHAAQRAATLTRQLLAFSRRQVFSPVVLDLNRLLTDMEKMLRPLIREDIKLEMVCASDVSCVCADAAQLEQVVVNLVVNARDAMPEGGALTLETNNATLDADYVALHAEARAGQHVMVAVSDTGMGMDTETRRRAFEPFYTTKQLGEGTGLGLAMVHGIVRQSGGHITVYSEPGQGTTFRVYLPAAVGVAATEVPSGTRELSRGGHETILMCEDDRNVREATCRTLEAGGYTVLAAESAESALRMATEHVGRIQLLLTDVIMPGMNGRQLADALLATGRETRVLYVSGYTDNVISHHGVLEEGVEFLEKPFTSGKLLRRIREVLDPPRSETRAS